MISFGKLNYKKKLIIMPDFDLSAKCKTYKMSRGIRAVLLSLACLVFIGSRVLGQEMDLLLKGGHVIDPKNSIDAVMDVAIAGGKILKVSKDIPSAGAKKVIDAAGLYITPGLIDLHTHVFVGSKDGFADGFSSLSPDDITFKAGITTVVDAGTSGWRNFPLFKKQVIDRSQTRILAFLNIAGSGMTGFPSEEDINDMDPHMTSLVVQQYPEIIVGVKLGHYRGTEWTPLDRAIEAGNIAGVPLLLECHLPNMPLEGILERMRPGDIYTHTFCTAVDRKCILDENGIVRQCVLDAQKKGIRFDVGHGGAMFHFAVAVPALKQGILPNSFGSDLHRFSMNSGMKNMLDIMSKFLNMGMTVQDIIFRATWNSAMSVKRTDIGHLSEGSEADIAVLSVQKGNFGFVDAGGNKLQGDSKFETEMTIRGGKIVWDQDGLAAQDWKKKQP
jgi:dihydroorotase